MEQRQTEVMLPPNTSSRYDLLQSMPVYQRQFYTYYVYDSYGQLVPRTGIRRISDFINDNPCNHVNSTCHLCESYMSIDD